MRHTGSRLKDLARALLPPRLWAALRSARYRLTLATFPRRTVRHTYGGHALQVCIADPLGQGWYDHDWPAMPEIELLARHGLRPGARAFDLGAHQCVVAMVMSRIVGAQGQVVAVEVAAHDVAIGRINQQLNRTTNLELLHAAVAREAGEVRFDPGSARSIQPLASWSGPKVPAVAVDDLTKRYGPPDVVFVDVEGYELEVLRGAHHTFDEADPDWFVEVHTPYLPNYGGSVDEVLAFFPEQRYERFLASEAEQVFRPFAEARGLLEDRFFLVALARQTRTTR